MKKLLHVLPVILGALLSACETSSIPTVADLDRCYQEATRRADVQIADLTKDRNAGRLSQEEYDYRVQQIRNDIPRKANDIAWTRHALAESERRAQGIPTPDAPVQIGNPDPGAMGGSFYKQAGDPSGNMSNGDVRFFSPVISGYSPGTIAGKQGGLSTGY